MTSTWASRPFRLFDGQEQTDNFARFSTVFPVRVVRRSAAPQPWPSGQALTLPARYRFNDRDHTLQSLLDETRTCGLAVAVNGRLRHEFYGHGLHPAGAWPLWSITKSVVGTLVGSELAHRARLDLAQPVSDVLGDLVGSGYEGVTLEQVLQMGSGVRWNEDYADPASDIRRSQMARLAGGSQAAFMRTLPRTLAPGTSHRYNTTDTEVLGRVLHAVTGRSLAGLLEARLWAPMGMASDAFWVVDGQGAEWAGSGLVACLTDVLKLGQLYLEQGHWQGQALLDAAWARRATTHAAEHLAPGALHPLSSLGYGYHWWTVPEGFCAIGIYNQFLYVDRARQLVIAKFSANPRYGLGPLSDDAAYRHEEHLAAFRAIARATD